MNALFFLGESFHEFENNVTTIPANVTVLIAYIGLKGPD